jgi:long-chain acyl-CoA synthetase
MDKTEVYNLLEVAAQQWPHNAAVHDAYGTLDFASLYQQVEKLRIQLVDAGIVAGMGIGLKAQNGRNFIVGLFAIVGCGAVAVPMSHQLKQPEIDGMLQEAHLHAILFDDNGVRPLDHSQEITMDKERFWLGFTNYRNEGQFAPHVSNAAFMRFTSGTTGKSKGVIISHQSVVNRIEAANKALCLAPGDTVVWALPMAYHFVVSVVLYIRFGAGIAIAKDFLAPTIIDITQRYKGTLLYASPILIRLLAADKSDAQMTSLHTVISTSEGISADVCNAFQRRFGIAVSQAYGIIEIGLPIINKTMAATLPDAVGYAVPGYTVDILDDEHQLLPVGAVGHLGIKGPGMFDAYLSPPCMLNDVLQNGYFLTADFASKDANGLIKVEGRMKSVINVSGSKVFPEEVEAVLQNWPGIKLARISGAPHPLFGQIIIAEIVLEANIVLDEEAVLTFCRQQLSPFKIPQRLMVVDELPITGSGKLIRH